jgi:hypothetical protein
MNEGWQCPVCKSVYAPWVSTCQKDHTVHASSTNIVNCTCGPNAEQSTAACPVHSEFFGGFLR